MREPIDVTEDVFKLGSKSPAAILLDAAEQLEKKSPKADDDIQLIRSNLVDAVDSCVAAAGHEYSSHWQKQLLKAAAFGKTVLDNYDSDEFVAMCETVRVLNAVRFYETGMPLSYEQYLRLTPERLVQRLVNREQYLLALRLSEYLRLPKDVVYVHWASRKVRIGVEDEETVCKQIVTRMGKQRNISYEKIARAAFNEGRTRLASGLLEHEKKPEKQVRLLLDMEEDTLALDKAMASDDTDLILYVLLQIKAKKPALATFFRTINTRPIASSLVESTARYQDQELLKDLYYQDDRRLDGANLLFEEALKHDDFQQRVERMKPALKLLQDSKECNAQARMIEDAGRLLRLQKALDDDPRSAGLDTSSESSHTQRVRLAGLSLNETVYTLVRYGSLKRAQQIAADYKIPERTQWWLRLRGLIAARSWRELESIAGKNRKSPIGWEPFVTQILNAGNPRLAGGTFVPKCTNLDVRERMDFYMKCGMMKQAGEEAVKAKDKAWLEQTRDKADGRDKVELERLIGLLAKGR